VIVEIGNLFQLLDMKIDWGLHMEGFKARVAKVVDIAYEEGLCWSSPDALEMDDAIAQAVEAIVELVRGAMPDKDDYPEPGSYGMGWNCCLAEMLKRVEGV